MFNFGLKKIKFDKNNAVWLKKLSLTDFLDIPHVSIVGYAVHMDKTDSKTENNDNPIKQLFEKAIVKVKGTLEKDTLIDGILKNEGLTNLLYSTIFFLSCKKKMLNTYKLTGNLL